MHGLQLDDEGGAAAFLALHTDGSAVLEDDLTAETETDAGARGLGGEEGDEGVVDDVGRHAAAVVADADFTILSADDDLQSTALVGVADEVRAFTTLIVSVAVAVL